MSEKNSVAHAGQVFTFVFALDFLTD